MSSTTWVAHLPWHPAWELPTRDNNFPVVRVPLDAVPGPMESMYARVSNRTCPCVVILTVQRCENSGSSQSHRRCAPLDMISEINCGPPRVKCVSRIRRGRAFCSISSGYRVNQLIGKDQG